MAAGKEVGRLSIKVTPDLDGFYRELKRAVESAEKMKVHIPVEPDMGNFRQEVAAATRNLPDAKVKVDVDRSMLDRVGESLRNFKLPDVPSVGGVPGAGVAAIGVLALAATAPLIGLLTSALLTLPGLIAAVAVPVGALALGLDGLKAAAGRLAPAFEDLKASMSGAVESQFTPVFDQLGKILPTLKTSLPAVSQGLADLAKSFTDTITSAPGIQKIQDTIGNIGAAISRAAPGIASFTDGLLTLAEKFSEKLPAISDWFNGAGESFKNWINELNASGTLDKAFDGLGASLKVVADTLGSIAAEGLKFFQDPKNIQDFNAGLQSIGGALRNIVELSNTINNLGDLFKNMLPTQDLTSFGNFFKSVWSDITQPFTSENAPWRDMWASLQSGAQSAWASVTATVSSAIATISGLVSNIGATISGAWDGLVAAASAAFNGVISSAQSVISGVVSSFVTTGAQVLAEVSSWPGKIAGALASLAQAGLDAGRNLVQGLINGISGMIGSAIAKAQELASSVAGAVKGFLGIHSPSKLMEEYGVYTGQGFVNGIESQIGAAEAAARKLAGATASAVQDELDTGIDFGDYASKGVGLPISFARANAEQAMSDLGIGGGALTAALGAGLDFGVDALGKLVGGAGGDTFQFNVTSVDDAIAVKNNEINKKALTYTRR
ncbi:tape measure protein [Mycobacterium phage Manatee]|uniref:tail length tape measure protein n=1 Tax=Mycobacterium phage Pari TaxID=1718171 RepID=UPI000706E267|nr:tail length tape measure protein [Mycobacterium phage Pari]ALH46786.1 tape measure protein [Mycobacterium phage Pari]QEA11487.1 tape measure protein [Mycobacterium phage Anglerfish]QJD53503.1 tape measure protein [Mycobacterium phage Manatee]